MALEIKLYGAERCHKTQHYKSYFETRQLDYKFLDVEENTDHAEALRSLYKNRKLNFPTITLDEKKLRNPRDSDIDKWIEKLK
ncbi:glutaredoxin family protein [Hwangdonia lutea]|uniref:Glutaredoxin family protein n=1 Tax=Hwangdonia lutea TaxID=3075823 RepID=A0AA97ENB6_9FLAO|nr:glutaredoxin family protein [Hwangdonia sp. SCSIO 19198]WOD44534.1 glutaredoxin family protein [Hwangdonia sp. SCSIO 19198]